MFLGGRSPEHDVSILTGLQALQALDQSRFEPFVVYVTPQGGWLVGPGLEDRRNYLPDAALRAKLSEVTLDIASGGTGHLAPRRKSGLFARRSPVEFDVALLAFHGLGGEDGQFQGLFEAANIPYTGMRTLASAVLMDKVATKRMLAGAGIPLLRHAVIERPEAGLPAAAALETALAEIGFPCCVKPVHLGSSIGVGKADTLIEEVRALLAAITFLVLVMARKGADRAVRAQSRRIQCLASGASASFAAAARRSNGRNASRTCSISARNTCRAAAATRPASKEPGLQPRRGPCAVR